VQPDNQEALVVLLLALTDQFAQHGATKPEQRAREYLTQLTDMYERIYYEGLIHERRGRAYLARGPSHIFAYESLRDAMGAYETAMAIRPDGNDDAILRWNACVRTIQQANLQPPPDYEEAQLE
jgi:hypothetical protein